MRNNTDNESAASPSSPIRKTIFEDIIHTDLRSPIPTPRATSADEYLSPIDNKRRIEISHLIRASKLSTNLSQAEDVALKSIEHYSLLYQLVCLGELMITYQSSDMFDEESGEVTTDSGKGAYQILSKIDPDTKQILDRKIGEGVSVSSDIGKDIRNRLLHSDLDEEELEVTLLDKIRGDKESFECLSDAISHALVYRTEREVKKILRDLDSETTKSLKSTRDLSCHLKRKFPEQEVALTNIDNAAKEIQSSNDSETLSEKKEALKTQLTELQKFLHNQLPLENSFTPKTPSNFFSQTRAFLASKSCSTPAVTENNLTKRAKAFQTSPSPTVGTDNLDDNPSNNYRWHLIAFNKILDDFKQTLPGKKLPNSDLRQAAKTIRAVRNAVCHKPTDKIVNDKRNFPFLDESVAHFAENSRQKKRPLEEAKTPKPKTLSYSSLLPSTNSHINTI